MLLHPPADSWPGYQGDYSGRRHSKLTQITPQNVNDLSLAWAFQTNQPAEIKSTPILVDGVLYFTVPDNVWAIDARSGQKLWQYTYPPNKGDHIGQRGVAIYKDWLFLRLPGRTPGLSQCQRRQGAVDCRTRGCEQGLLGHRGAFRCGEPRPGGRGRRSGQHTDVPEVDRSGDGQHSGSGTLRLRRARTSPRAVRPGTAGTYDPDLNLIYWGTGNPTPVLDGNARPGDDEHTCSIVALNPDTGQLVWSFQPSPHDTHDWDAVEIPVLVDGTFHGQPRKMLMKFPQWVFLRT